MPLKAYKSSSKTVKSRPEPKLDNCAAATAIMKRYGSVKHDKTQLSDWVKELRAAYRACKSSSVCDENDMELATLLKNMTIESLNSSMKYGGNPFSHLLTLNRWLSNTAGKLSQCAVYLLSQIWKRLAPHKINIHIFKITVRACVTSESDVFSVDTQ